MFEVRLTDNFIADGVSVFITRRDIDGARWLVRADGSMPERVDRLTETMISVVRQLPAVIDLRSRE